MSGLTRIGVALAVPFVLVAWHSAEGKSLSKEACAKLVEEHGGLLKGGIVLAMNKDPEKAREELQPEKLANIERFLFIDGQIRFRCPNVRLPAIKAPELSEPRKAKVEEGDKKPEQVKKPDGPPAPPPKRKPDFPGNESG